MQKDTNSVIELCDETGIVTYTKIGPFRYRTDLDVKGGHGQRRLEAGLRYMFEETDALIIEGWTPIENKAAHLVARRAGYVEYAREDGLVKRKITISRWLKSNPGSKAEEKRPKT
jgi:hypothetical protein